MRKVKKYDFGEWLMHSHLPEIRSVRTNYAVLVILAIITAVSITYFQFSGMSDSFTDWAANVYLWLR